MSNEAFRLLSRGGVTFDNSRSVVQLFNVSSGYSMIILMYNVLKE